MTFALERVIDCQERLIEALDQRDVSAISIASTDLAGALETLSGSDALDRADEARLDRAVRQAEAARIRVNVLSHWTRQRLERLGEIRGQATLRYGNRAVLALAT
ncbi:hypothetical protein HMF7854_12420 [Sphingomonas ginkgonis]|uniref:Flagellar protein FlgN n=1 Tax=Sphingomonas ginkgonis TaxID=2315330 RepID=A0A3S0ENF2_9SPHN|nr:hypothetical protein [Sphingomonas ginkgonis]RST31552.1 hypothetical protein HMF7854_12420 [Sphingomonas ginkgonis]